jgi:hypothetical protein
VVGRRDDDAEDVNELGFQTAFSEAAAMSVLKPLHFAYSVEYHERNFQ